MTSFQKPIRGPSQPVLSLAAGPGPEADEDRSSFVPVLLNYWHTAVRWRLVIAAIFGACLLAGLAVTLLMAPLYTARTGIEISREQKNVTNVEGVESEQAGRDLEFYATQYSLLKAESLAKRVARRLNLAKSDDFFRAHGVSAEQLQKVDRTGRESGGSSARERLVMSILLQHVDVQPVRNSRLVDIIYTSRSPEMSALLANTWVEEFIGSTMDRQFSSTADARHFLEGRLEMLKARLEQSERDAVAYASGKNIIPLDEGTDGGTRTPTSRTLASANLEALNEALQRAQADRIVAQSRIAGGSAANSVEVLTNPAITQMRARRAELAAQHSQLMVTFEPEYPAARAVQEQIIALDAAISQETGRVAKSRQQDYQEAVRRERDLEQKVGALKAVLDAQRHDAIQYNIYQRDADTNRQLYDALLQRYKEVGVAGAVGVNNISVVDEASVPTRPSAPNMTFNLALALLAGLSLSVAAVIGLEQIDEGIRRPEDVSELLSVPLLGSVPLVKEDPVAELSDPRSQLFESYFSVRSTLAFATTHGLPRTVALSSARSGEGKSTTAFALADLIGRTGKNVLLVDADLRMPSLHRILNMPNEVGLSNLLAGEDDIAAMIQETGRKGLYLLTSGPLPPSPPELLSSTRLAELLQVFLKDFDHVVIDAPPVLGLADALLIGRTAEGVVFVVEAEKTPRRAIRAALRRLRETGNQIFGATVTKVAAHSGAYGYAYGYRYGYGRKNAPASGEDG
ncbi:putative exopolysaccharide biosynthesis protein [Sphingobium sp. SYK-6]|uniref:GumC family protein n=1 Tax=Sphingobium sp. (strain NBRC 103272 / SYK-6) TaxID=627192 RepID=UPI0002276F04|nr:polysaccharide biosynthesis tyrosine autokinase [Sphingobium sp. SYK-6]BAK66822.1 putative exopolysaccharide biosynthesis protein [Sphingobium sp. SYK-6]